MATTKTLRDERQSRHSDNMSLYVEKPAADYTTLRYDYAQVDAAHRTRVQDAAVEILAAGKRAKESIITMGQRLIEVKAILPDGTFTAWITTEFELSDRMARNFMNVARQYGDRPEIISVLNDTVLYLLAAPSTPESAREEVEAIAVDEGKSPQVARVRRVVKAHKPTPEPTPAPPKSMPVPIWTTDDLAQLDITITGPSFPGDPFTVWNKRTGDVERCKDSIKALEIARRMADHNASTLPDATITSADTIPKAQEYVNINRQLLDRESIIEEEYNTSSALPETVTVTLDRAVAQELHAAILVGGMRYQLSNTAIEQLKQSLKEALS